MKLGSRLDRLAARALDAEAARLARVVAADTGGSPVEVYAETRRLLARIRVLLPRSADDAQDWIDVEPVLCQLAVEEGLDVVGTLSQARAVLADVLAREGITAPSAD
jgi:hypothetical protein